MTGRLLLTFLPGGWGTDGGHAPRFSASRCGTSHHCCMVFLTTSINISPTFSHGVLYLVLLLPGQKGKLNRVRDLRGGWMWLKGMLWWQGLIQLESPEGKQVHITPMLPSPLPPHSIFPFELTPSATFLSSTNKNSILISWLTNPCSFILNPSQFLVLARVNPGPLDLQRGLFEQGFWACQEYSLGKLCRWVAPLLLSLRPWRRPPSPVSRALRRCPNRQGQRRFTNGWLYTVETIYNYLLNPFPRVMYFMRIS